MQAKPDGNKSFAFPPRDIRKERTQQEFLSEFPISVMVFGRSWSNIAGIALESIKYGNPSRHKSNVLLATSQNTKVLQNRQLNVKNRMPESQSSNLDNSGQSPSASNANCIQQHAIPLPIHKQNSTHCHSICCAHILENA